MDPTDLIVVLVSALVVAALGWFFFAPRRGAVAELDGGVQRVQVTVRGGYSPDVIRVRRGVPVELVFDRRESGDCTSRVVFSDFALSASLQPYAGHPARSICEYPVELKSLAWDMTVEHIARDADGLVNVPEAPGLGLTPNLEAAKPYLLDVEIAVGGKVLYRTPELDW